MTFVHLDQVLAEVAPLGRLFSTAGFRLFLVGGIVRDQLLDVPLDGSSDIDLTTNALPADIKRIVAPIADDLWTQGEKFGTIGLRVGGRDIEITTHRAESYTSDSRKPIVSFGDNIDVDLSRRDFTVNAMAIELPDGDLVDPFNGAPDLETLVLRTPLSAEISFTDDPLRMLRAARFATKYELQIDPTVHQAARELHQRIRIVAIERIGVELKRLLGLANAAVGLNFLADVGLMAEVLSYGEPPRISQVTQRLAAGIEAAMRIDPDWRARLGAIGVAVFDDADGVQAMCDRLRLSREDQRAITRAARSALTLFDVDVTKPPQVRRWIHSCLDQDAAVMLARGLRADRDTVEQFEAARDALMATEAGPTLLGGDEVMAALDVGPGPVIGKAQTQLLEQYFELGPVSAGDQARHLRSWWATQQ